MRYFTIIFSLLFLQFISTQAQWINRYPRVDGYDHHTYLEGYDLPVLSSGPTYPAPSPLIDEVVFSAKGWLWVLNFKTSEAKRITFSPDMDSKPNWSPDGKKIVFVRDNGSDTRLVILDLNSKKESVLVNSDALDLDPIFSDDGKFIYYASAKNGSIDLYKIDIATLESKVLTNAKSLERLPVPVNEGTQLVYLHKEGFSYDAIKLLNIENDTSSTLVEENFASQADFTIAPDNKTLVYTWPNGEDYELRLLNITIPKSKMLLTKSEGLPLSPKFSVDGKWVYFSENNKNETSVMKRISAHGGIVEVLSVKKWDWGVPTGKIKITSLVDEKIEAVRMSITDESGHPIIPESGIIHSDGQNGIVFFYSPGEIEVEVPLGTVTITVTKGFSTPKKVQQVKVQSATTNTKINLTRIWNAKQNGWYAADNHFHLNYGGTNRLDPDDILLDLKAEEIDIAFPLVANLGNRYLDQYLIDWKNDDNPIISFGQEIRSHFLGHISLIGIKELYWPWFWGPIYDIYRADDRLNAEPLNFARDQGGLGGYVHPVIVKDPFIEENGRFVPISLTADAVLGELDIFEVACLWSDEIGTAALWHEFLNLGIPIALSAGSDVMNNLYRTMAIGSARIYVKAEGKLTIENYLDALKKGRSFVSNGPQILFSVADKEVGDVIESNKNKANWKLMVYSPVPYDKVEIFVNGEVVWITESKKGNSETYTGSIDIPQGGWVTARVSGAKSEWPMMDSYVFAESSPFWFNEIGSAMPNSKINAAKKLLKVLEISEERMEQGYGANPIPKLEEHFLKARTKLLEIIDESKE